MRKFEKELEQFVQEKLGISKEESNEFVNGFETYLKQCVKAGDSVQWTGFFVLRPVDVKEREYRNPSTGDPIIKEAHKNAKFKVSKKFTEFLNE